MGRFVYEGSQKAEIDDRTLHHLQVVVTTKLRRGEPFLFTWKDDTSIGGGRSTVWLHPGCNLVFSYSGGRVPDLNRQWVEVLASTANAPSGLYVVREPAVEPSADPGRSTRTG